MRQVAQKIRELHELKDFNGILCHGCFDVLHVGHVRNFIQAKLLDDTLPLIVTLTADAFIKKGVDRPIFTQVIRAEVVAALEAVDYVAIVHEATGLSAIHMIRPRFYVKGKEYEDRTGINAIEHDAVEQHGGQVMYMPRWYSSTQIIQQRLTHV